MPATPSLDGASPSPLPAGRSIELAGRGETFVHESGRPRSAPTVMLLHGLGATAALNWFTSMAALSRDFHVVALDHRGHGRGIRDSKAFTLEDAADDVVAVAEALGVDRFIVVGYSMGGPIATLLWRRHPECVSALVLCATSDQFRASTWERVLFAALPVLEHAFHVAPVALTDGILSCLAMRTTSEGGYPDWARAEVMMHDGRAVLRAARTLGAYSAPWINEIDVPTAVLVHARDQLVAPARQFSLASRIPDASTYVVEGDHFAQVRAPQSFRDALLAAVTDVAWRDRARTRLRDAS